MQTDKLLERLMLEYGNSILRMCCLYLKDYHLAEDAVQETFVKAMKSYQTLQNNATEKTWLTKIAINCCKNVIRTRWFRTYRLGLVDSLNQAQSSPLDDILERNTITTAIAELSPNDREVILLYYYQNLSLREIASVMSKKENIIAQRLHRARARLKKILLEVGYVE